MSRAPALLRADVRRADFGTADGSALAAVLHYYAYADRTAVIERLHRASG